MSILLWIRGLVGNNLRASLLIAVFVIILTVFATRCSAAPSVSLSGGASFGCLSGGPVLGLDARDELAPGLTWNVGTTLWGAASGVRNNWDWHARMEFSRGHFGAAIGPAYLQSIDSVNGSHAEMSLTLFWRPTRVGVDVIHLSNAGTTQVNCGRNAVLAEVKLR